MESGMALGKKSTKMDPFMRVCGWKTTELVREDLFHPTEIFFRGSST